MNYSKHLKRALNGLAFDNDIVKPLELVAARLASSCPININKAIYERWRILF